MGDSEEIKRVPKPKWLRVKLPTGENYRKVRGLVEEYRKSKFGWLREAAELASKPAEEE